MYKDKNGDWLSEYSVVKLRGNLYCVESIDKYGGREYFVKLRNGCVNCWSKPQDLEVVPC